MALPMGKGVGLTGKSLKAVGNVLNLEDLGSGYTGGYLGKLLIKLHTMHKNQGTSRGLREKQNRKSFLKRKKADYLRDLGVNDYFLNRMQKKR